MAAYLSLESTLKLWKLERDPQAERDAFTLGGRSSMSLTSITSSVSHRGILAFLCHLTAGAACLRDLDSATAAYPPRGPPTVLSLESLLSVSLPPASAPSESLLSLLSVSLSSVFPLSVLPRSASVSSVVTPLSPSCVLSCLPVDSSGRLPEPRRGHQRPYHAPSGTVSCFLFVCLSYEFIIFLSLLRLGIFFSLSLQSQAQGAAREVKGACH